jgi:hypothetical protein
VKGNGKISPVGEFSCFHISYKKWEGYAVHKLKNKKLRRFPHDCMIPQLRARGTNRLHAAIVTTMDQSHNYTQYNVGGPAAMRVSYSNCPAVLVGLNKLLGDVCWNECCKSVILKWK